MYSEPEALGVSHAENQRKSLPDRRNSLCKGPLGGKELVMFKTDKVKEAGRDLVGIGKEPRFYPKSSGEWSLSRGHMRR